MHTPRGRPRDWRTVWKHGRAWIEPASAWGGRTQPRGHRATPRSTRGGKLHAAVCGVSSGGLTFQQNGPRRVAVVWVLPDMGHVTFTLSFPQKEIRQHNKQPVLPDPSQENKTSSPPAGPPMPPCTSQAPFRSPIIPGVSCMHNRTNGGRTKANRQVPQRAMMTICAGHSPVRTQSIANAQSQAKQ